MNGSNMLQVIVMSVLLLFGLYEAKSHGLLVNPLMEELNKVSDTSYKNDGPALDLDSKVAMKKKPSKVKEKTWITTSQPKSLGLAVVIQRGLE